MDVIIDSAGVIVGILGYIGFEKSLGQVDSWMKNENIRFLLEMTKSYLDGIIDKITFLVKDKY